MSVDNVLFVGIDSLTRTFLDTYPGGVGRLPGSTATLEVETPHLDRFAQRATVFETHYAGSLPCMPARREWLCGVNEFLWRPWGPVEPFDTTLPLAAREAGILAKLITDHYHYVRHGSGGYVEDFTGYTFVRGHEFDAWRTGPVDERVYAQTADPSSDDPRGTGFMNRAQYARNVADTDRTAETDYFAPQVFGRAADWLGATDWERWLLVVDSFDVHEPFDVPEPYASMYTSEDPTDPDLPTWPFYGRVDAGQSALDDRELAFVRAQFAAKVTMVDHWFGRLTAVLDDRGLWDDTMVVVTSDHGHYLGEHGLVGKPFEPVYDTLARTPLLLWHPAADRDRVEALTTAVDLHATVAGALGIETGAPHGESLLPLVRGDRTHHRDCALYGYWGQGVNVTDGRYTYLHPAERDAPAELYSTTMQNPYSWFTPPEPRDATVGSLPYADCPVWQYDAPSFETHDRPLLFDVDADPGQESPIQDADAHDRLHTKLVEALERLAAPASQFERLALATAR